MTTVLTAPADTGPSSATLATKLLAVGACVAMGLRVDVLKGVTPGVLVMIVLAPVWWPQVRHSRMVQALVATTALSLVAGFTLSWLATGQRGIDWRVATSFASNTTVACAGVVVLLWARTLIAVSAVIASFAGGVLLYQLSIPAVWLDDPWKFGFARPVTVLVLVAVAWSAKRVGRPRPVLVVLVLVVLALVSATFDYRSESGFLALVAILVVWQAVAVGPSGRVRAASPALLLGAVGVAVYLIATQLFVSGALGTEIQQRSTAQIEASGSLLLGGRPEWSATVELMGNRAVGYGMGVLADSRDVQLADNGFASISVDPATGYQTYITNYMLYNGFHLHSVAADLWAATGPAGLLLSLVILVIVVWGLSASLAVGRAEPVLIYGAVVVMWDLAFSPLFSSVTELQLGLFLALVSVEQARRLRAAPAAVPSTPPPPASRRPSVAASVLYGAAAPSPDRNGGRRGHH